MIITLNAGQEGKSGVADPILFPAVVYANFRQAPSNVGFSGTLCHIIKKWLF
jgi:hypothetical protein